MFARSLMAIVPILNNKLAWTPSSD